MTRVNLICTTELHYKHLVAEYRENPRIFGLVRRAQAKGLTPADIRAPDRYTLGPGHCLWFYDKLGFLSTRQSLLVSEMMARGYTVNFDALNLGVGLDAHWFGNWTPSEDDVAVSRARILERLATMGVS